MASVSEPKSCEISIEDEGYMKLINQVMEMKPSKRKNFKSHLFDKWGIKTRVIYKNNHLWNYQLALRKYCKILPMSVHSRNQWKISKINKLYPNCENFVDAYSKHHKDKEFIKIFYEEARKHSYTKIGAMAYLGLDDSIIIEELDQHIIDTHTGNSDGRARKVKVTKNAVMHTPK